MLEDKKLTCDLLSSAGLGGRGEEVERDIGRTQL